MNRIPLLDRLDETGNKLRYDAGLLSGRWLLCRKVERAAVASQSGLLPTAREALHEYVLAFATADWPAGSVIAIDNEHAREVALGGETYCRILREDVVLVRKPV